MDTKAVSDALKCVDLLEVKPKNIDLIHNACNDIVTANTLVMCIRSDLRLLFMRPFVLFFVFSSKYENLGCKCHCTLVFKSLSVGALCK